MVLEDFGVKRQETVLSNGDRLVLFERLGMPLVISAMFFAGSRFDPLDKEGTAHFLEHMLVAGTKRFPTKDKLAAYIEQYGGRFYASTSVDNISVNVSIGDPLDISRAIEILHEILLEPLFDEKTFEAERGSILKELSDKKSNPNSMVWEVWRRLFFQDTLVGRSTLGFEESINSITKKDVFDFYKERILSGKMVIVASGGVEISELGKRLGEKVLLPGISQIVSVNDLPILRKNLISIEPYKEKEQVSLILGFRSSNIFHLDVPALDVVAEVLGGGRASTLQKRLRYDKGLVYSVGATQLVFADSGSWVVKTSTSKDKLQEVLNIICDEFKRVFDNGLTSEEVKFAQDKIEKSQRMEMQTSSSWVGFHSLRELWGGDKAWTLADYSSEIRAVTPEATREVAQKYFGPDKWYLAICGDVEESEIKIQW